MPFVPDTCLHLGTGSNSDREEAQPDVDDNEMPQAKNFDFMFAFCKQNPDILGCIFKPGVDMSRVKCEMLMAQVLIAPLSFDTRIPQTIYGFPESQAQVYASPVQAPLLFGHKKLDVNIPWILHVFNFFRYHFLRPEEATLFSAYTELNDTERLSLWTEPIADVPEAVLGKVWKGTYCKALLLLNSRRPTILSPSPIETDQVTDTLFSLSRRS